MTVNQSGYRPRPLVGPIVVRVRGLSPPARVLHRAILNAFATTGRPPDPASLPAPGGHDYQPLLRELHELDIVRLDARGGIRAAYPFSGTPTAHTVAIAGGPTVWAMCAIDALGMAAMLGRDVTITSRDPYTGEPIRVDIRDRRAAWEPDTGVVVDGADAPGGDPCGPGTAGDGAAAAADRCCHVVNFFTGPATATAWLGEHPAVSGVVLTREQALRLGVDMFGALLDD